MDYKNDELYHHGVKGQKWGVRKDRFRSGLRRIGRGASRVVTTTGRIIKSAAKGTSNAYKQHRINKEARRQRRVEKIIRSGNAKKVSKNINKLSQQELNEAVARINMNRQLKSIYKPTKIKQDGIIKSSVKNAARNVLTNTATTMLTDLSLGRNPLTAYKERITANREQNEITNARQKVNKMNLDKQASLLRYDPGIRVRSVVNKSSQVKLKSISLKHSDLDDFLIHHGVKGMKWGVRNEERLANLVERRKKIQDKYQKSLQKQSSRVSKSEKYKSRIRKRSMRISKLKSGRGFTLNREGAIEKLKSKNQKDSFKMQKALQKASKSTPKTERLKSKMIKYNFKIAKLQKKIRNQKVKDIKSNSRTVKGKDYWKACDARNNFGKKSLSKVMADLEARNREAQEQARIAASLGVSRGTNPYVF